MPEECVTESKYDKQRKAMKSNLDKLSKETDSTIVSTVVKEKKVRDDVEIQGKLMLMDRLVSESREMVNEGKMTFDEAMKDLSKLVLKI